VSNVGPLVGWGVVISASVVAGAVTAAVLRLRARVAAVVTSFGGGILLAAVAFELVPDADKRAGLWVTAGACSSAH
jgi:ZIP family zinc transporter